MQGGVCEQGVLRRWRRVDAPDAGAADRLARSLGVPPLLATLLACRGVTPDDAEAFLSPSLQHLHDPALLHGTTAAAARLKHAVEHKQPIVIYGDYDVDGVTGSAVLWHTLRAAGGDPHIYSPHRLDEGYGLSGEAIEAIADDKPDALIISVDCGITAVEPARIARQRGVDLIITDHHAFDPDALPEAHTLVHPALAANGDAPYPNPHLCGAGVAFKVAWQFAKAWCGSERVSGDFRALLLDAVSLVALGTVADVVPLVGENRTLTVFGLGGIKRTRFVGLNALIDAAQLRHEKVDAYHVGFVLGPRLNACGRMGHARDAARMLTDAPPDEAKELAEFLTGENDRRRATERRIFQEAAEQVRQRGDDADDRRAIVVASEGWHAGVVGIVASRLVEMFCRPAVVLALDNGTAQGSARSVDQVSIHDAIATCAGHLEKFGGHAMAAGLTLRTDAVDAFREQLVRTVNTMLTPDDLCGTVTIDAQVAVADCNATLFGQLQRLAPFGRGNPTPRLLLRRVTLQRAAQRMGGSGRHLQMHLRAADDPRGPVLRAIAWGRGDDADDLPAGLTLDVVFKPTLNTWRGLCRPELHLEDWRIC